MQRIATCLWFNNQAEEAANYYMSLFKNSRILNELRTPANGSGEKGNLIAMAFELDGIEILALNGNTENNFNPSVSLFVNCKDQEEVDYLWDKLTEQGKEVQCGWLVDKFGVSWQIVPPGMMELMTDKDREKASRAMNAMMKMIKLDINELKKAVEGN